MTARSLISSSLRLIGAVSSGDAMTNAEAVDGLAVLNDLIDSWRGEHLTLYAQGRNVHALTLSQQRYTIGTGGNLSQSRPLWVDGFGIVPSGGQEREIRTFTRDEWRRIGDKARTGSHPEGAFYNPTFPLGAIDVLPIPLEACSLVIYAPAEALVSIASLDTAISQPPGWARALRYNLAVELCPEYGKALDPVVGAIATESKATIKRYNQAQIDDLTIDSGLLPCPRSASNSVLSELE